MKISCCVWPRLLLAGCVLWLATSATAVQDGHNSNNTQALDRFHPRLDRMLMQAAPGSPQAAAATAAGVARPVTSIKVRVQADEPKWQDNIGGGRFVSSLTPIDYRTAVDSVNMASVEGLLFFYHAMYLSNKNKMNQPKYVVFYKMQNAQPPAAMQLHHVTRPNPHPLLEHGPYVRFDDGRCNSETGGEIPKPCKQFAGAPSESPPIPRLGYYVGGKEVDLPDIQKFPYPNTYWFSYPGSCPTRRWAEKDAACRTAEPGGLCPLQGNALGVPDGTRCTFNYEILGWVDINEVFTKQGANEATFFANGNDAAKNTARIQAVLAAYAANLAEKGKPLPANQRNKQGQERRAKIDKMQPLPTVESLRTLNPPCYETAHECRTQPCQRVLYSQICKPCTNINDPTCVRPPANAAAGGQGPGGGQGKPGAAAGGPGNSGQGTAGQIGTVHGAGGGKPGAVAALKTRT